MTKFTIFEQITALIPRTLFNGLSEKFKMDRHGKGFTSWDHFLSLLCGQLCNSQSLRDICFSMSLGLHDYKELGISKLPTKSNLSYRNNHCDPLFFEQLYHRLRDYFGQHVGVQNLPKLKGRKIYALDSTLISLCVQLFDWAKYRQGKGGVKMHVMLDFDGFMPSYMNMSTGKVADNKAAMAIPVPANSVVVADRGYMDFKLLDKWNQADVFFVVRCKDSQKWDIERERPTKGQANIVSDCDVRPEKAESAVKYDGMLRKVTAVDPGTGKEIELLTNQLSWTAETISLLYKKRWEIENFFKSIKQRLRVKSFIGTSHGAVLTQLWISLITMMMLKVLKAKAKFKWNLSNLVNAIRAALFTRIALFNWLDSPKSRQYSDIIEKEGQLSLFG
jgi:hypothetical protein